MNRTVIVEGRELLVASGFKVQGSERIWHDLLKGRSDRDLQMAFRLMAQEYPFKEVRPASLIAYLKERLTEDSYQGAGKENVIPADQWHRWKERREFGKRRDGSVIEYTYDYAWSPVMQHKCHCPRCR